MAKSISGVTAAIIIAVGVIALGGCSGPSEPEPATQQDQQASQQRQRMQGGAPPGSYGPGSPQQR